MSHGFAYWDKVIYKAVVEHNIVRFRDAMVNGITNHHKFFLGFPTFRTVPLITHIVRNKFDAALQFLLKGPYIDTRGSFIEVCRKRDLDMIDTFLSNACARHRDSAECLFALLETGLVNIAVEFINRNGFDVFDQCFQIPGKYVKCDYGRPGQSPLHVAALMSVPDIVDQLLNNGARVDLKDGKGFSPLYCACLVGSYECCEVLIQHGASAAYVAEASYMTNPRSPLIATCHLSTSSTENDRIAQLLRSAGVVFHQETWISGNQRKKCVSDATYKMVMDNFQLPPRLDMLCCQKIRSVLKTLSCGSSIVTKVEGLPLLNSIIEFYFFLRFAEK